MSSDHVLDEQVLDEHVLDEQLLQRFGIGILVQRNPEWTCIRLVARSRGVKLS